VEGCIHVTSGANDLAGIIHLDQATGDAHRAGPHLHLTGHVVVGMLQGRKNVAIGKAHVGMRMHVSVPIRKGCDDSRVQGIVDIEDEGSAGVMVIGEEHSAGRQIPWGRPEKLSIVVWSWVHQG
jgi:hypothetical protein